MCQRQSIEEKEMGTDLRSRELIDLGMILTSLLYLYELGQVLLFIGALRSLL